MNKKGRINQIILFTLLLAFWLIIVPQINLIQLGIGAVVAFAITIYSKELLQSTNPQKFNLKYLLALLGFIFTLLFEIVKANIDVAKVVLSPKLKINPHFVKIKNPMKSDLNKVIYGNAITLTPGTLTVVLENNYIIIHALTDAAAEAEGGSLETAVKKLEVK